MAGQNIIAAASLAPKVLFSGQITATTSTTIYTAPGTGAAIIKHGTACNTSGSPVNVSISVHQVGSSIDGTHRVISVYALAAGDTLPLGDYIGGCNLGPGDFIVVLASVANVLDIVLTGVEST